MLENSAHMFEGNIMYIAHVWWIGYNTEYDKIKIIISFLILG